MHQISHTTGLNFEKSKITMRISKLYHQIKHFRANCVYIIQFKTLSFHSRQIDRPLQIFNFERHHLRNVPRLGLRHRNNHTLKLRRENHLAPQPRVLIQNPIPRIPLQHVLLVVGSRRELLEPLLRDADLALGRAGVDVLEPVGSRID